MNLSQQQDLVDTIQRCAALLHRNGRDVVDIFKSTRDLNISIAKEALKLDMPTLEPITIELAEFSPNTRIEAEEIQ